MLASQIRGILILPTCRRVFHTSSVCPVTYYEHDPKFGYSRIDPNKKVPLKQKIEDYKSGMKQLKKEIKLWKDEKVDYCLGDPQSIVYPFDTEVFWKFNENTLDDWVVSSDSDYAHGFSSATLGLSPQGHGMFSGNLCTQLPTDGEMKRAGYCNLKSKRLRRSFQRESCYEWTIHNHLVIRCRGDGRSYLINLHTPGYFDITWGDMYSYNLYTRGGPYWQVAKIPFSKFFFQSKGRVQDHQQPIPDDQVSSIGFTMCDQNDGPFQLEIDYIGVEYNPNHTEEFAYEMYLFENEVRGIVNY